MIKINLLNYRKVKKIANIQKQILLAILLLVLSLGMIGLVSHLHNNKIERLNDEIKVVEKKLNEIEKEVNTVKEFEEKKKRLEHIIKVISGLKKNQANPTRVMDDINMSLPDEIWLTSFEESTSIVKIQGFSFSDPGIARFMKNLEQLKYLSAVELQESKRASVKGDKLRKFVINCKRKGKK